MIQKHKMLHTTSGRNRFIIKHIPICSSLFQKQTCKYTTHNFHDSQLYKVEAIMAWNLLPSNFKDFLASYCLVFKPKTSSAVYRQNFLTIFEHFITFHLLFSSSYYNYLSQDNRIYTIPSYVKFLIESISREVNSRELQEGWVGGTMRHPSDVSEQLGQLKTDLTQAYLTSLLKSTPFSKLAPKSECSQLVLEMRGIIDEYIKLLSSEEDEPLFDHITQNLTSLPNLPYNSNDMNLSTAGFLPSPSTVLGIYRFRNTDSDYRYCVQATSMNVKPSTVHVFGAILKLLKLQSYDGDLVPRVGFNPGDQAFNVDSGTIRSCYDYIFGLIDLKPQPKKGRTKSRKSDTHSKRNVKSPSHNREVLNQEETTVEEASLLYGNYIPALCRDIKYTVYLDEYTVINSGGSYYVSLHQPSHIYAFEDRSNTSTDLFYA